MNLLSNKNHFKHGEATDLVYGYIHNLKFDFSESNLASKKCVADDLPTIVARNLIAIIELYADRSDVSALRGCMYSIILVLYRFPEISLETHERVRDKFIQIFPAAGLAMYAEILNVTDHMFSDLGTSKDVNWLYVTSTRYGVLKEHPSHWKTKGN